MKKICTIIVIASFLIISTACAVDNSQRVLAEELLILMDVKKNTENTFENVKKMILSQVEKEQMSDLNAKKEAEAVVEEMMDMLFKELSWDKFKDYYIDIYAETFTEEELKGIIEFYKSPIGQKFIKKTPELMEKGMEIVQKQMNEIMPKIDNILKKY